MKTRLMLSSLLVVYTPFFTPTTYTGNFTSGLGIFDLASKNTTKGNNFGWSDSNHTFTTAGMIAGQSVSRTINGFGTDRQTFDALTYTVPVPSAALRGHGVFGLSSSRAA